MKKNYSIQKQVAFVFLFLFLMHLTAFAQSKNASRSTNSLKATGLSKNVSKQIFPTTEAKSNSAASSILSTTTVSACDSYTWAENGQTYTTSGTYTSPGGGITQGFNNQTDWNNSAIANGATVAFNDLAGLTTASPIVVTIGGITATINAPGGMYSSGSFVGSNIPNDPLTITFSSPIYGISGNFFDTDISDVVISGNVTATYSDGFVDSRTVSADSELFGYFSTTPITSLVLSTTTTTPNRYISIRNISIATTPNNILNLTINTSPNVDVLPNVSSCISYTLPALSVGNYFTGTNGTGTALSAGNVISSNQTIYIFAQSGTTPNCTDESSFNITIEAPTTTPYVLCQGETVTGGLNSNLGGNGAPLPNFVGDNTGGPTFNRPLVMNQGGTCGNSGVGSAVRYVSHSFVAPATGTYAFSTCSNATWDTFLSLYQNPFNPAGLCAGNSLIASADDNCGAQSNLSVTLTQGTSYTLVVSGFANTDIGTYIVTSTTPSYSTVEWYTNPSGGTAIAFGSPFNPVGVAGSGITDTNTAGTTSFYAQFPGSSCRTETEFTINSTPIITCPGNITVCENEVVNYTVTSNTTGGAVLLTQNTSNVAVTGGGIGCNPGGDNTYYRVYDLAALGYTSDLTLNNINFKVELSAINRIVTVNAYTLVGSLMNSNLTLLGSAAVPVTTAPLTDYVAVMGGLTVPSNSKLVLSYSIDASTNNAFLPGANAAGQSGPTYIKANSCGITEPIDLASIGFGGVHVIIEAELTQSGTLVQTAGLPSGSIFPVGTTTVTYVATNSTGCSSTCSFDVIVNEPTAPLFTQVAPICTNATLANLPTTSTDGVTGIWSPAIDNTVTTTYTFTPDTGQCATTTSMTIVVNPNPIVGFTANPFPVCEGSSTVLTANVTNATPTISTSSQSFAMNQATFGVPITTTLSGTLFNTASNGCATFTPGSLTGKIALIQRGTCTFAIKAQNAQDAGAIAVIIYNNVAGNLLPGGTAPGVTIPVYGITLANGQALIAAMTTNEVNVTLQPAPTMTYLWSNGETTQSINTGILSADTLFSVTATNTVTGCSLLESVTVPVTQNTVPTFTQVASICSGETLSELPTTSNESLTGTWSPALNNTATTTYTFTPDAVNGLCLTTTTMTITVNSATMPTGDSVQTFAVLNTNDATIADIVINPISVVWYGSIADAEAEINPLPSTTILTSGTTYYAVNNDGTCSSDPFGVTVTVTLGNDGFDNLNFSFYPNPTSSILNIRYSKEISEVTVTNLLGQTIMTKKANATEVQIDLSRFAEATYFVKVVSDGNEKTIKVIKQN